MFKCVFACIFRAQCTVILSIRHIQSEKHQRIQLAHVKSDVQDQDQTQDNEMYQIYLYAIVNIVKFSVINFVHLIIEQLFGIQFEVSISINK